MLRPMGMLGIIARAVQRAASARRMSRRRCVACGYTGTLLRLRSAASLAQSSCPACGQDFYERPPRSYAELEGFAAPNPRLAVSRVRQRVSTIVVVYRELERASASRRRQRTKSPGDDSPAHVG